jgi:hypothetical protein
MRSSTICHRTLKTSVGPLMEYGEIYRKLHGFYHVKVIVDNIYRNSENRGGFILPRIVHLGK